MASGWIQDIFGRTPEWAHVPLATLYGMVQPFLPAALMDNSGVVLMRVVMVLRAVGWFAVLPILLYASWTAPRLTGWWCGGRYYHIPRLSLYRTFGLVALSGAAMFAGGLWYGRKRRSS